jgi:taurine dioxygenase
MIPLNIYTPKHILLKNITQNFVLQLKNNYPLSKQEFVDFSKNFGIIKNFKKEESPYYNIDECPRIVKIKSKETSVAVTPHSDYSWQKTPPRYTLLYGDRVPKIGGNTVFFNTHKAYDNLPYSIKNKIENLKVLNQFNNYQSERHDRDVLNKYRYESIQNIVKIHPITFKKYLFVNKLHSSKIIGLDQHESDHLLKILFQEIENSKLCSVKWDNYDITIFDNMSVQHAVENDYDPEKRELWRCIAF